MKRVLTLFVLVMVLVLGFGTFNAHAYLNSTPLGPGTGDPDDGGDGGGHPWGGESTSPSSGIITKESVLTAQVITGIPIVDVLINYVVSRETTTGVQQPAAVSEAVTRAKWEEAAHRRIYKYDSMRRER